MSWEDEIERARALLGSITRDRHLPAQRVAKAYEAWARDDHSQPFARYLIDNGLLEAVHVRLQLRRLTVKGLPLPDEHTYERFEDLLLCQLALDAEILTPKLVSSVRKVQDKKIQEGKLRRLKDLLPRAGVDPKVLAVCVQHLHEKVLLCRGCLGRYPRKGTGPISLECPRCGYVIERSSRLGGSGEFELTPAYTRMKLEESQDKILRTITVAERAGGKSPAGVPPAVVVATAALLVLVLGAGIIMLTSSGGDLPPLPASPSRRPSGGGSDGDGDEASQGGGEDRSVGLSRIRMERHALLEKGDYEGLARLWQRVDPDRESNSEGVRTQRDERLSELRRLVSLAKETQQALAAARAAPRDAGREEALARLVGQAATDTPPFGEAAAELASRRAARRQDLAAKAEQRVLEARRTDPPVVQFWERQKRWVESARPTISVRVDGQAATLRVLAVERQGFLVEDGGSPRHHPWDEDPALSLAVAEHMPGEEPEELLYKLRYALLARSPAAAESAAGALGLRGDELDPVGLIGSAPVSSLPVEGPQGLPRIRYPVGWVPHDLTSLRDTQLWAGVGELYMEGESAEIETRALPVTGSEAFSVSCALETGTAAEVGFGVTVKGGEGSARSYRVRWRRSEWSLELDLGGGWNRLRSGSLASMPREAKLELEQGRLKLYLDGVQVGRASLSASYDQLKLVLSARGGKVTVRELSLAAPLDRPWLRAREERYQRRVELALLEARGYTQRRRLPQLTALSVDDPQGRAVGEPGTAKQLDQAIAELGQGRYADALELLDSLPPGMLAGGYYRAYLDCLNDDPAGAVAGLRELLEIDSDFAAARALLSLAEARAGRLGLATQEATRALDQREDLALGWLALARVGVHERDLNQPGDLRDLRLEFDMPWALAPGDPLVERELRALDLLDLYASWCPRVAQTRPAVVWSAAEAGVKPLERLAAQLATRLRRRLEHPLLVIVFSEADYDVLSGKDAPPARFEPETGALLCREPLELVDRAAVRAVVEAYLTRTLGRAPAWLQVGLVEQLTTELTGQAPSELSDALTRAAGWDQDQWLTLLRQTRRARIAEDTLMQAKAWFLLGARARDDGLAKVIDGALEQLERGEAVDLTPFSVLDLGELEQRLR